MQRHILYAFVVFQVKKKTNLRFGTSRSWVSKRLSKRLMNTLGEAGVPTKGPRLHVRALDSSAKREESKAIRLVFTPNAESKTALLQGRREHPIRRARSEISLLYF